MKSDAYWLLPDGTIHYVKLKHINEIINCPELFGETEESIKITYDAYKEKMPHEGTARVEIMKRVIRRGYIRIRERRNHWVIQLYRLSPKEHTFISKWVKSVWNNLSDKYADIKLNTLQNNELTVVPIRDFLLKRLKICKEKT